MDSGGWPGGLCEASGGLLSPRGGHCRPAESFGMAVQHSMAGHLSRASLELLDVFGLDVKRPECLLEPLGVIFEALVPS